MRSSDAGARQRPKMLGHYHVLEELGRNALGPVHLARLEGARGFQRWALLRVVDPAIATKHSTDLYHRARAAGLLIHPNVAALFEIDEEEDGTLWLASEFVQGASVAEVRDRINMARTPAPWEIASRVVLDAAQGLAAIAEAANKQRIHLQHGTLTPWRMLVSFEGKTKIIGAFEPQLERDPDRLPYTAPEEIFGEGVDARADVFSLGVILWELCAGKPLFHGGTPEETTAMIEAHRVARVSSRVRGFPAALDEVIKKAVASRPDARYASPRELARAIQSIYVAERAAVSDEDVSRYVMNLCRDIADGLEDRLREAADTTEVYKKHRRSLSSIPTPELGKPAIDDFEDDAATEEMRTARLHDRLDDGDETTAVAGRAVIDSMTDTPSLGAETVRDLAASSSPTPKMGSPAPAPPPPPKPKATAPLAPPLPKRPRDSFADAGAGSQVFFARTSDNKLVRKTPAPSTVVIEPSAPAAKSPFKETAQQPTAPAAFTPIAPPSPYASPAEPSTSRGVVFAVIGGVIGLTVFLLIVSLARPREEGPPITQAPSSTTTARSTAPPPATTSHAPIPTIAVSALPRAGAPDGPKPTHAPPPKITHPPIPMARGGYLTVMCEPACDDVILDGSRSLGESPVFKAPVSAGSHKLVLRAGSVERATEVTVPSDGTALVKPVMK